MGHVRHRWHMMVFPREFELQNLSAESTETMFPETCIVYNMDAVKSSAILSLKPGNSRCTRCCTE